MKASPRDINSHLSNLDAKFRAVLVFGKDDGLIRERRDILSRQIVPDTSDAFSLCVLSAARVREDQALIADEMGAVSMTGGRRLVRLDDAGDRETGAIKNALAVETGDALLLVSGGDLGPRSSLRVLFEKEAAILAIPCYPDTPESLRSMISAHFRSYNIEAGRDVVAFLTQNLGGDRLVTRAELDKITNFLGASKEGGGKSLALEDAMALTSDASTLTLGGIAAAATGADQKRLAELLDKAEIEGINSIEILRKLQTRLQQLHLVRGLVDEGTPLNDALKTLRPPLFFKDRDVFTAQVRSWPQKRLMAALNYTIKAEVACKTTGNPDFTIARRACLDICQASVKNR